jgi:nitrogen fixation protein NifQ
MKPPNDCRMHLMTELLGRSVTAVVHADPLRPTLASLLAGRSLNEGVLPATLGLTSEVFQQVLTTYFPGPTLRLQDGGCQDIPELDDLIQLLQDYRAGRTESELWIARIVAYGCAGRDHLWHDLGLANRGELSALMATAFPALAVLNVGDMKWKKFLYRHYCARDGIYVCPAPSCSECIDFSRCFAPEDK